MKSLKERFDRKWVLDEATGCHLWVAWRDKDGYGKLRTLGGMRRAHRVAWELAYGPIPDGVCVLHKCDTPPCVFVDHLFLGTEADNRKDMVLKGRERSAQGEDHYKAKLTNEQLIEIRARYAARHITGITQSRLAAAYGISQQHVSDIIHYKRRKDSR